MTVPYELAPAFAFTPVLVLTPAPALTPVLVLAPAFGFTPAFVFTPAPVFVEPLVGGFGFAGFVPGCAGVLESSARADPAAQKARMLAAIKDRVMGVLVKVGNTPALGEGPHRFRCRWPGSPVKATRPHDKALGPGVEPRRFVDGDDSPGIEPA